MISKRQTIQPFKTIVSHLWLQEHFIHAFWLSDILGGILKATPKQRRLDGDEDNKDKFDEELPVETYKIVTNFDQNNIYFLIGVYKSLPMEFWINFSFQKDYT